MTLLAMSKPHTKPRNPLYTHQAVPESHVCEGVGTLGTLLISMEYGTHLQSRDYRCLQAVVGMGLAINGNEGLTRQIYLF